jgi:hypothetical protein
LEEALNLSSDRILNDDNPSGRSIAQGSTQPLTEISTRNISLGVKVAVCRADSLTTSCADCLEIL